MGYVALLAAALGALGVAAAAAAAASSADCVVFTTCGTCILTAGCKWCSKIEGKPECMASDDARSCEGKTYFPQNEYKEEENNPTASQIHPQKATLKLRVGTREKFKIVFKKLEGYPVDLYYLMDLSASMNDDKSELSKLGRNLTIAMQNITSNFQLGFGSFVDKRAMPYINTAPKLMANPCQGITCAPPYSFKNHMTLTKDTDLFSTRVSEAKISGNVDAPEGGFDALMQAMVCKERINWRPDARHLLVMATDATFHLAGDGKLGGVVVPNDERCHMNDTDEYKQDLEYDYPSISQIDRVARENHINIIFAVTEKVVDIYKNLGIKLSTYGVLSNNSNNVINLVTEHYHKLVQTVELIDNAAEKHVNIRYETRCQNNTGHLRNTNLCRNVNANRMPITFHVNIDVPSCPKNSKDIWNETITISPKGINESMQLHLEVYCGCPCEQEGHKEYIPDSHLCHNNGTEKCGACECKPGRSGQYCECDDSMDEGTDNKNCISDESGTVCSGRGYCHCRVCKCTSNPDPKKKIYGRFCECDNFSCPRYNNLVCSGEDKGDCKCGKCVCHAGWSGEACENIICGPDTTCFKPGSDEVCSGYGDCECGMCKCRENRTGPYCEGCLTCPQYQCNEFGNCVEFLVHQVKIENDTDCEEIIISEIVDLIDAQNASGSQCTLFDDAGCSFTFVYEKKESQFLIVAEKEKKCPAPVDLLGIIFGVIGGTVLLGLLIIAIWKIVTTIHDRREFAKFEQERALAKWERGDNPLYIQATSTFSNPTFNGS